MVTCKISNREIDVNQAYSGAELRPEILKRIRKIVPDFGEGDYVSMEELNKIRHEYLQNLIRQEKGELNSLIREVVEAMNNDQLLAEHADEISPDLTLGQKMADKIAEFGGSWTFIICFFSFLLLWMMVNVYVLVNRPFDPFPFILLNLILSCLAAIQAPIIMMSQNRKEAKDRARVQYDYKVDLKAELEIRLLHEKIDHLTQIQHHRLLKIQQIQTDYLLDILRQLGIKNGNGGKTERSMNDG